MGGETGSGGWNCLGRVEVTWEGGKVGVVPGIACGGAQNRPPGTESPSRYQNTLLVGLGSAEKGCFMSLGRVELAQGVSQEGGTVAGGWKGW